MFQYRMRKPGLFSVLIFISLIGCQSALWEAAGNQGAPAVTQANAGFSHDLSRDEEAGGHTLRKHVGLSDQQLRERLQQEPNIAAASTYTDRQAAELAIGTALHENHDKIERWLRHPGGHPNLVLDYNGNPSRPVGRTLRRGKDHSEPCAHAVVVLKWTGLYEYYVLTSYPECR
jgi:Bacterial CdiA-CT RNAse A domain